MSDNTNNTPDKSSHFVSFSDIYILMQVYQENRAIRTHILQQVWEQSKTFLFLNMTPLKRFSLQYAEDKFNSR